MTPPALSSISSTPAAEDPAGFLAELPPEGRWDPALPPALPLATREAATLLALVTERPKVEAALAEAEAALAPLRAALAAGEARAEDARRAREQHRAAEAAARVRTRAAMLREHVTRLDLAGGIVLHAAAPLRGEEVLGRDYLRVLLSRQTSLPGALEER